MSLDVLHACASIDFQILGSISRSIVWRAASKHNSISYVQIIHVKGVPSLRIVIDDRGSLKRQSFLFEPVAYTSGKNISIELILTSMENIMIAIVAFSLKIKT